MDLRAGPPRGGRGADARAGRLGEPRELADATRAAAAAIAGARIHVLDGHAHMAHKTDPPGVAGVLRAFLGD